MLGSVSRETQLPPIKAFQQAHTAGAEVIAATEAFVVRNRRLVAAKSAEIAAMSLAWVAALAWNSAFQTTFDNVANLRNVGPWAYAVVITAITVGGVILLESFIVKVT